MSSKVKGDVETGTHITRRTAEYASQATRLCACVDVCLHEYDCVCGVLNEDFPEENFKLARDIEQRGHQQLVAITGAPTGLTRAHTCNGVEVHLECYTL